jgi:hypothetical protein
MLPAATERILRDVPDGALLLDVGGWAAPFNRADWVLDLLGFESRVTTAAYGPAWERFSALTWVQRDICDRAPWPWPDGHFAFATCVTTLEGVRDPIWVCQELSRVARAGYVEVPTIEAELVLDADGEGPWLGGQDHRWFCELSGGELVFTHKPHSIHHDWSLRVLPRWRERMAPEDHHRGLFWEGALPARERFLVGAEHEALLDELRGRLRERFEPSATELRAKQARDVARQGFNLARKPARSAAERVLDELKRRRP